MEVPSNLEEQTLCDDNEKNKVAQTKLDDQIIYKFRGAPLLLQNIDIVKEFNTQDNYVKRIQYFANKNIISSISENNILSLYDIVEDESSKQKYLSTSWKKEYNLTILYDIILENLSKEPNEGTNIILSRKDHPVTIYYLDKKGNMSDLSSLKICKRNSEKLLSPLTMKLRSDKTLIAGGNSFLFCYDLHSFKEKTLSRIFKKSDIISTIDLPNPIYQNYGLVKDLIAIGKFDKKIALYSPAHDKIVSELKAHVGGITHLKFMPNNNIYLFSGARKDNLIYLWDLRKPEEFLSFYERKCNSNQRIYYDVSSDGSEIFLGNQDGTLISYKVLTGEINSYLQAHEDCVNSVSFINYEQQEFLITSSGQRNFIIPKMEIENESSDSSFSESEEYKKQENNIEKKNGIKLWKFNNQN